jgi:hypothetical protein
MRVTAAWRIVDNRDAELEAEASFTWELLAFTIVVKISADTCLYLFLLE